MGPFADNPFAALTIVVARRLALRAVGNQHARPVPSARPNVRIVRFHQAHTTHNWGDFKAPSLPFGFSDHEPLVIEVPRFSGTSVAMKTYFPSLRRCTSISQHESQPRNPLLLHRILGSLPLPLIRLFGIALQFAVDQSYRESLA